MSDLVDTFFHNGITILVRYPAFTWSRVWLRFPLQLCPLIPLPCTRFNSSSLMPGRTYAIVDFSVKSPYVLQYLREKVSASWSPSSQLFCLRTAINLVASVCGSSKQTTSFAGLTHRLEHITRSCDSWAKGLKISGFLQNIVDLSQKGSILVIFAAVMHSKWLVFRTRLGLTEVLLTFPVIGLVLILLQMCTCCLDLINERIVWIVKLFAGSLVNADPWAYLLGMSERAIAYPVTLTPFVLLWGTWLSKHQPPIFPSVITLWFGWSRENWVERPAKVLAANFGQIALI